MRHPKLYHLLCEHLLPLLGYIILSVICSWPTVQHFTTTLTSDAGDARHNVWVLWHVQQAILGHQPLFDAPLLYYPQGISMLLHGVGPVAGLLALPFWAGGPVAAYNGALLTGLALTGYGMYRLARGMHLQPDIAFFAGLLLLVSEMHLAGLLGHIEKTFLGLLPLTFLALYHLLTPGYSPRWALATATLLLLTMLHSGWQFILAALALGFFWLAAWVAAPPARRRWLLQRGGLLALSCVLIVGPLFWNILTVANTPTFDVAKNLESFNNQPDLVQFLMPSRFSLVFGAQAMRFAELHNIPWNIETTISLTWTGLILGLIGVARGGKQARPWAALLLLCMLLALGPSLQFMGRRHFTEYALPIILPYAFLTRLPGLDFMRTPGQFMLLGFVCLSLLASLGLAWLTQRWPTRRRLLIILAISLVLLERWPQPWPQEQLRPVPDFYRQLAQDQERYGVFDLPIKASPTDWDEGYSSFYQMYQMTHGKGVAVGYLSRGYSRHPLFPCIFTDTPNRPDVLVNGTIAGCYDKARYDLIRHGYRYVVWHKPQPWTGAYQPGTWAEQQSKTLLQAWFGQQAPLIDDALVQVYPLPRVATPASLPTSLELGTNWHNAEDSWRWATSPATLIVTSPSQQAAHLQLTPAFIHDPTTPQGVGHQGVLAITHPDGSSNKVQLVGEQPIAIPLTLQPGTQVITLTLEAGNFRPSDYGTPDGRLLSFATRSLNLQTNGRQNPAASLPQPAAGAPARPARARP